MLMPSCGNRQASVSKPTPEPNAGDVHHSASRTLTTNQPSPAGARPDPPSSRGASGMSGVYGATVGGVDEQAVPILPSRDLEETLAFYERLGFESRGEPIEVYRYL